MSESIREELVLRWSEERGLSPHPDALAVEAPLEICVGDRALSLTLRTPGHDLELAVGYLLSEGILRARRDLASVSDERQPGCNRISLRLDAGVRVPWERHARFGVTSSSCGLCGKNSLEALTFPFEPFGPGPVVDSTTLVRLPAALHQVQRTFAATGGLHAAGLFTTQGKLVACREDIGRHNAVDKILGHAFLNGLLPADGHVLLVSGRASFELTQKALAGGVRILAAVSAPSSFAVRLAREAGLTLVGFLRDGRFNVYAGIGRVRLSLDHSGSAARPREKAPDPSTGGFR